MKASIEEMAELNRFPTAVLERMPHQGKAVQQFQESLLLFAIHETLTEAEHAELLELSTLTEAMDAQRLELLSQLATLRQVPRTQLISELNLPQSRSDFSAEGRGS